MDALMLRRRLMMAQYLPELNVLRYAVTTSSSVSNFQICPANFPVRTLEMDGVALSPTTRRITLPAGDHTFVIGTTTDAVPTNMFTAIRSYLIAVELVGEWHRLEEGAFLACQSLRSLNLPDTIVYFGKNAISQTKRLSSVNGVANKGVLNLPSVTYLGATCLTGIGVTLGVNIGSIKIGDVLTEFGGSNGYLSAMINSARPAGGFTIDLGAGLQTIYGGAIDRCYIADLIVRATTPPAFVATAQANIFFQSTIYGQIKVPSASVDAYKAAPGWSTYASYIVAI